MKTLYLECNMGAAGDMLMGALYELLEHKDEFLHTMNQLIPGVTVTAQAASTCGIAGTHMVVNIHGEQEESSDTPMNAEHSSMEPHAHHHDYEHEHGHNHEHSHDHEHEHGHHHTTPDEIASILDNLPVSCEVCRNAKAVYSRIADAESKAHGVPVTEIHFHEVGALDAIVDVTGVCLALEMLGVDSILASPIHTGSGHVCCAHGIVPVPAPATVNLLEGIPYYSGQIQGELCTPTGAALLAHFSKKFGPMPVMTIKKTGYGVGTKEFPAANCVRAFLGETESENSEEIIELCCHIDDMTAEGVAFACERLMEQGALDVSTASITMKKGRTAIALTVVCKPLDEERLAQAVLRETTSNGVRVRRCTRYFLTSSARSIETEYGTVQVKCADGFGIHHEKPEYDSAALIAKEKHLPFEQVWNQLVDRIRLLK
ncbi:hypothetical protein OBV_12520 [Oscillibacter valericigenes Sjm18-20]|nr:hypothetical protein OBV_12520 [Oscillibacter valericigenes Sjm18-20]